MTVLAVAVAAVVAAAAATATAVTLLHSKHFFLLRWGFM
jgi:hypothetical protein